MSVQQYELIFNCTPTQFGVAMGTTLPAAGFTVVQAPIKFQGLLLGASSGAAGLGQIDFSYDGQYFLRFFGANPVPVAQQAQAGIPQTNMLAALITYLNSTLLATLGAPVTAPNLAIPPVFVP